MWTRRSIAASVLVGTALITAALAAVPGPKDPRYPDYIVNAGVKCVEVGSFHHPKNCSWYYRCVDRLGIGFFSTFYFECEPGTVFSDALDQCVHPHLAAPPCGGVVQTTPTPTPTPTTTTRTTPTTTTPTTTASTTTTSASILPCVFREEHCRAYEFCRPSRETRILCSHGCFISSISILMKDLCGSDDMLYDNVRKECVPRPTAAQLCQEATTSPPDPVVTISTTNVLRCSTENTRPFETWIGSIYCKQYELCTKTGIFQETVNLCDNFYQCRRNADGSWFSQLMNCRDGLKYSYERDECVPMPSDDELC